MTFRIVAVAVSVTVVACSGPRFAPSTTSPSIVQAAPDKKARQHVYWTFFAGCSYPAIMYAKVPLKRRSKPTNYACSTGNELGYTSGMAVDSSERLWVLSFAPHYTGGKPGEVAVFKLPLQPNSVQEYTFILSGTNGADNLAFDPSGNLWVAGGGNNNIAEYEGPSRPAARFRHR